MRLHEGGWVETKRVAQGRQCLWPLCLMLYARTRTEHRLQCPSLLFHQHLNKGHQLQHNVSRDLEACCLLQGWTWVQLLQSSTQGWCVMVYVLPVVAACVGLAVLRCPTWPSGAAMVGLWI